jgi:hypothetical protein
MIPKNAKIKLLEKFVSLILYECESKSLVLKMMFSKQGDDADFGDLWGTNRNKEQITLKGPSK